MSRCVADEIADHLRDTNVINVRYHFSTGHSDVQGLLLPYDGGCMRLHGLMDTLPDINVPPFEPDLPLVHASDIEQIGHENIQDSGMARKHPSCLKKVAGIALGLQLYRVRSDLDGVQGASQLMAENGEKLVLLLALLPGGPL